MINWFDMPAEGLSNGGLFEIKELEVTENGTYETSGEMYNKVTVNVEGGGGSSDFSTAEVTLDNTYGTDTLFFNAPIIVNDELGYLNDGVEAGETATVTIPLYKGKSIDIYPINGYEIIGNVSYDSEKEVYFITGDATIQTVMYHITINSVPIEEKDIYLSYYEDKYIPVINGVAQTEGYTLDLTNGANDFAFDVIVLDSTNPYKMSMNAEDGITHTETGAVQFVDDDGWLFNITGDGSITLS